MTNLERDLEALFDAQTRSLGVGDPPTLGRASRPDPASESGVSGPAVAVDSDVDTVDLGDRIFEAPDANRVPWLPVVAAAAVVALVVSLLVVSFRDVDDRAPAAPPPVADALTPVTDAPPVDPVGEATAFWESVVAGDRTAALSYVGPDGEPVKLFGRAETLENQFDWYEAVGWQWVLEGCAPDDVSDGVRCEATATNAWSDAMGVDPVTGSFVLEFDDDGIITDVSDTFATQWVVLVFEPFRDWVSANHPGDAEVMWGEDNDDDVNAEILGLYEINTERFVTAQLADRSTITIPTQEEP